VLYTMPLVNQQGAVINEERCIRFEGSYAYGFSLSQGQKLVIRFSVYYVNVTATLRIFGQGKYSMEYNENDTLTSSVTGMRYFLTSTPSYYTNPDSVGSGVVNTVTATNDDAYYIEFMGDGSSGTTNIWSEPGNYVLLVYGSNSGTGPTDHDVKFNITISLAGLGKVLSIMCTILGWSLIGLVALKFLQESRKRVGGV
jgi:hypothetical protein